MATVTAQKVKLYKETYDFVERFNRDSTWRISLLNAIKKSGKKNHLGTPLIGYAWIIFKKSPQFATSHGFKLLDALRNQQFDEFATTLDDLFTQFWKRASDREGLNQEGEKYEAGEIERPSFLSEDEHEKLQQIESMSEGPVKFSEYENFAQSSIEQFQIPEIHLRGENESIPSGHPGGEPTTTPGVSTEGLPNVHTGNETEQVVGHPGGEQISEKTAVPEVFSQWKDIQQPFIPVGQTPPSPPLTAATTPRFQFKSLLQPLKSLRIPTNLSVSIKKFISRNLTPMRIASLFTGAMGTLVGYGTTNTVLGAAGGGLIGGSLPTLVKQRGFGQMILSGVSKAGTTGGNFLTGLSGGGGRISGGGFFGRAAGGTGKKAAILALLGFVLLAAFLVGFSPAPGTPGGGSTATGSGTLTPIPSGLNSLGYNIPFRDTTVRVKNPDDIKNQVRASWPNAQLQNWDTIVNQSIANGWNPAFVLTLWIEESGAQGVVRYDDAIGCQPSQPTTDINISLSCLFRSFPIDRYPNNKFADFMCMYSESKLSPCQFITNPNFPKGIKDWYSRLVPDGPGALQIVPTVTPIPVVASSAIVTCPLSQNGSGSFRFICGTFNNPRGGGPCGHGNPLYYVACTQPPYAACPFTEQLKTAVDVRPSFGNGSNSIIYLPFLYGNQSVKWTKVKGPEPISGGADGYKVEYETDFGGKKIRIDLTHIHGTINTAAQNSGDVVSTLKAGVDRDGEGHLHTAVSVDGKWVDAISEAKLCTP